MSDLSVGIKDQPAPISLSDKLADTTELYNIGDDEAQDVALVDYLP